VRRKAESPLHKGAIVFLHLHIVANGGRLGAYFAKP